VRNPFRFNCIYSTFYYLKASPEVAQWMKELDGHNIPNLAPTVDGSCGGDPAAAADAANRGWWTCGGYTRDTGMFLKHPSCVQAHKSSIDIVACPDKYTWGVRSAFKLELLVDFKT